MDRVLVVAVSGDCEPVILLSSGSNLEPAKIFSLFLSIRRNGRKVLYNFQAEMKQRAIILPSNSKTFRIGAIWSLLSRLFFFYFFSPFLSTRFGEWRNGREVLYNLQTEMKQRAIIPPAFELQQFGHILSF